MAGHTRLLVPDFFQPSFILSDKLKRGWNSTFTSSGIDTGSMMLRHIKQTAYHCMAGLGIPELIHKWWMPDTLTILMYHAVIERPLKVPDWCFLSLKHFRRQMKYLRDHFEVLPLPEAVHRLKEGEIKKPTVVITFDDGYQNNHDHAFPILKEHQLPATFFLNTGLIDSDKTVWFCRLHAAIEMTDLDSLEWNGETFDLTNIPSRANASSELQDQLKKLTFERFEEELDRIILKLGCGGEHRLDPDSPYRMLDSDSIRTLSGSSLVEFGAHMVNHTIISNLDHELTGEIIMKSIESTAEISGRPCRTLAYPNGQPGDYDLNTLACLRQCDLEFAVTTIEYPNRPGTPHLELCRYGIGADMNYAIFRCTVHNLIAGMKGRFSGRPPQLELQSSGS
jgi:peptidoglycan/xylan/chitin deacetylase (PgdA/CDA1 family)